MSTTTQAPQTVYAEPALVAILRLCMVERGRDINEDIKIDRPFRLVAGDIKNVVSNKPWTDNLQIKYADARDYYLYEIHYDGIEYTFGPGDAVFVYANGALKGIVGQSDDNLKLIWEALTHANHA